MDKKIIYLELLSWVLVGIGVVGIGGVWLVYYRRMPPQIPLWYSRPWGEEQLARPEMLWLGPVMVAVVAVLAKAGIKKLGDEVLKAIVLASGVVVQITVILGMLRVVWLII